MKRGFTLVELMLAVLILAVIMALVYGVLVSTIEAQNRVEEITLASEVGPAILSQIRRDLEGAFLPKSDVEYFVAADGKGPGGDRDRIDFVTAGMAYGPEKEGEEAAFHSTNETGYQVQDNRNEAGMGILYRREDLFVDRDPLRGGRLIELYDRVRHLDLQFWDGEKWKPAWNNKSDGRKLPEAVRVELKILVTDREDKQVERSYSTTITFPK